MTDNIKVFPRFDAPSESGGSRFRLEDFDHINPGTQQWVVKELWPRAGLCFIAGPSMSGKSFWILDQLAKVTKGEDVLGRKSKACGVVYVASEGAAGVRNRITALRQRIGPLGGAFQVISQAPNLTDPDDVAALRETLEEAKAAMEARGIRLGVVAVDTLSASIPGADENTAKDMSPVLHALQRMAAEMDVCVIPNAHTGKDAERGLRGWSGLLANADGLIMLDEFKDSARGGTVVKVKDGPAGDRFGFELVPVLIGQDEDGEDVRSCYVESCDSIAKSKVSRKVSAGLDLVMRCFHLCIEAGQFDIVPQVSGVPAGTKGVPRDVLRDRLIAEGWTGGGENPDSIRKSMNRRIDKLIEDMALRGNERIVWEVGK